MEQSSCSWYMPMLIPEQKLFSLHTSHIGKIIGGLEQPDYFVSGQSVYNRAAIQHKNVHKFSLKSGLIPRPSTHQPVFNGPVDTPASFVAYYNTNLKRSSPHVGPVTKIMDSTVENYSTQIPNAIVAHNTSSKYKNFPIEAYVSAFSSSMFNSIAMPFAVLETPFKLSSKLLETSNVKQCLNLQPTLNGFQPPTALLNSLPNKSQPITNKFEQTKINSSDKRKTGDYGVKDLKKAKLETKALKAKRPGFTDERYQETAYFIENGLRKVYPYYFTFTTFTKARWVGEKILDVFAREFRAHPVQEYERCIQYGTLTVNFEKVSIDYRLKHNDLLANVVHRHEVPVTSTPITIVHIDDDFVVVNKPASIPVHPCGRYRHNTVVFILAKEFNLKNLRTIHRLDRLTSGLLLFGRSPKKARIIEKQIRDRHVEKEYICRVEGIFPDEIIECKEPIEVISYKIGVCRISAKGKICITTFQKLSQNKTSSVVLCKPLTGRMHQIRVHLQYLGYPILNDPLYNHNVFGPLKGRNGDIGGKTDEKLIQDLINIHNAENWLGIDDQDEESFSIEQIFMPSGGEMIPSFKELIQPATSTVECLQAKLCSNFTKKDAKSQRKENINDSIPISVKASKDKHCYECKVNYRDPKPKDLIMYLHAWKYKGPGWIYETELPGWAKCDWE